MDFYEAVYRRRTIRDFAEKDVPADTVNRILQAGLKAPTNNHLREWEFVVLRSRQSIEAVLGQVGEKAQQQMQALASRGWMTVSAACIWTPFQSNIICYLKAAVLFCRFINKMAICCGQALFSR